MVEALSEDYIRTAKAKGLPARAIVYRHGLRAALVPVVTIFGIDFGTLLAGHHLHRTHLRDPGHRLLGPAGGLQQGPAGRGCTALFAAAMLIFSNLIVDVVYSFLDPRVRLS